MNREESKITLFSFLHSVLGIKKRYNFVSRIIVFTGDFLSMDSMPIVVFLYLEDAPRMIEAADQIIK